MTQTIAAKSNGKWGYQEAKADARRCARNLMCDSSGVEVEEALPYTDIYVDIELTAEETSFLIYHINWLLSFKKSVDDMYIAIALLDALGFAIQPILGLGLLGSEVTIANTFDTLEDLRDALVKASNIGEKGVRLTAGENTMLLPPIFENFSQSLPHWGIAINGVEVIYYRTWTYKYPIYFPSAALYEHRSSMNLTIPFLVVFVDYIKGSRSDTQ